MEPFPRLDGVAEGERASEIVGGGERGGFWNFCVFRRICRLLARKFLLGNAFFQKILLFDSFFEDSGKMVKNPLAKSVKSADFDPVRGGTDLFLEAIPHFDGGGVRESQAQNIFRIGVGFGENLRDSSGQKMSFAGSGSGDHADRTENLLGGSTLLGVEVLEEVWHFFDG